MKLQPFTSRGLQKHGDSQRVVQLMMLGIAVMLWIAAKLRDTPVMRADTYGVWVTSFDAEVWAASIMVASFVFLMGILINGEWRWSPVLRLAGAVWHVLTLTAFCLGAFGTANGDPVVVSAGALGIVHLWFAAVNVGDLKRAVGGGA